MPEAQQQRTMLKCVVLGSSNVGKTSLLRQFVQGTFSQDRRVTTGADFHSKVMKLGDREVRMVIWDTAGQESFRSITRSYYRGAGVALLVYDVARRATFQNCLKWLSDARAEGNPDMVVVLVGNKIDVGGNRAVSTAEGRLFAEENGLLFLETSAKTRKHVDRAFTDPAEKLYGLIASGQVTTGDHSGVKSGASSILAPRPKAKSSGCC
mmetsp:Transcript_12865/g.38311  ORF Transcript_12865/g.38311 Transcript_12865/m.38311 type:complete len:209 (+) Transcript_12865:216-842(+)